MNNGTTIIQTDELDEFEVKAIIAADGVNSEVAEMVGARKKFTPHATIPRGKSYSKTT